MPPGTVDRAIDRAESRTFCNCASRQRSRIERVRELGREQLAQLLAGAVDPVDRGALGGLEDARDIGHRQLVPVVQLERELRVERQLRERGVPRLLALLAR